MCGISGLLNYDQAMPVDRSFLENMAAVIRHRGPDEEGFYVDGRVGLGIRRLKIIDLATGSQPIHNEDGTVWLVFNGEIYNYRELRALLETKGHNFYTQSDTECIVHLYEEYQDRCVEWLTGMFAFGLWDVKKQRLLLARDRVGEKQLYYYRGKDSLVFGSEIKCILQCPEVKRSIDLEALREFLAYLYVPGERTIFEGIRRLPPGHVLICDGDRVSVRRYWELDPRPPESCVEADLIQEFRSRFREAVKVRLVSDVPLGAFLSGGIDSSAVVATMAEVSSQPVRTFTIGYDGEGNYYDERRYARIVAERFGTDHHELVVEPNIEDIVPQIIRSFDEPFGDSSAIPNYYISKFTREHVTVAMSGLGGDEIAGGYERYLGVLMAEQYRRVPRVLRDRLLGALIRRLPDSKGGALWVDRAKRFVAGAEYEPGQCYERYLSAFSEDELARLFVYDLGSGAYDSGLRKSLTDAFNNGGDRDILTKMMLFDLANYLPDDLLVLTDRLSMAHSLEVRSPFLDHKLLEFSATIPSRFKVRRWTKKYFLKRAFATVLPDEIINRRKKGFSVPLAVWFRGPLRAFVSDWLSESRVKRLGYFDYKCVADLLEEHMTYRNNHEKKIWALLLFIIWHDMYMN